MEPYRTPLSHRPPRPTLRGGVRREGDAPRGGGTTLEVSICLFLSGNTSCSCLTAVAAALFVAVDYALRLTKNSHKNSHFLCVELGGRRGSPLPHGSPRHSQLWSSDRHSGAHSSGYSKLSHLLWDDNIGLSPLGFKNAVCWLLRGILNRASKRGSCTAGCAGRPACSLDPHSLGSQGMDPTGLALLIKVQEGG